MVSAPLLQPACPSKVTVMLNLKAAVEAAASFGKPVPVRSETRQTKGEDASISKGNVTKTVTGERVKERSVAEVVEKFGSGDGI